MKYIKLNSQEYKELGTYKKDEILTSMAQIEEYFGDIHYYYEDDYPDDKDKTLSCIGLQNENTGNYTIIWLMDSEKIVDYLEITYFSVYYDDIQDFKYLKDLLEIW